MKTALLHYWLTNVRGGEKVLAALGEMFPESAVYTHAFGKGMRDEGSGIRWHGHEVHETFIASLPLGRKHPQAYLPLMPRAARALKLDGYDLIVSSESGPIKGIRKPKDARHVCYCHTPMRYLWDLHDEYYRDAGPLEKLAMKLFTASLRKEDLKSAESVDQFVANSKFVAERIKRIYGRDAVVVHPPVDVEFFAQTPNDPNTQTPKHPNTWTPYYLFAGAQVKYKRLDLAEAACRKMGRRLVVAKGVSDEELRALYANAKALLFPGLEDFGIVPVEAQAAGTPVIAFGRGGALETVEEGRTGLFFGEQTVEALCGAIEEFESRTWDPSVCRQRAQMFGKDCFVREMRKILI